jgi:hypothetical protein
VNTDIEHLSHLVSPTTSGIIWLTDDELGPNLVGIYELNYLLNGLLTKTLSTKQDSNFSKSNFFLAENFGNPFFVGHTVVKSKEDINIMYKHVELIRPLFQNKEIEIFIFNRSKNTANVNVLKELSHKFKDIHFKNLNI